MLFSPWTQMIVLSWPPNLRFYEKRFDILRDLEDAGKLSGFRVEEQQIGARLGDRDHQLLLNSDGMTLQLLNPSAEKRRAEEAAETALNAIQPTAMRRPRVALQYLIPLVTSYEDARSQTIPQMLELDKSLANDSWDWALLLTGEQGESNTDFNLEFGIVRDAEVPERLSRFAGRMGENHETSVPSAHWHETVFPSVAFFADCLWLVEPDPKNSSYEALMTAWSLAIDESTKLVEHLVKKFELEPDEGNQDLTGKSHAKGKLPR